jgi:ABC-type multidrug transport system ATPase subunit
MLELHGVSKLFSGIPAVDNVTFSARPGEVTGYLGPNGSGKSTTMRMITALIERSSGQILFDGKPIENDLARYKQRLGYVPEEPHLYTHLSAVEYLEMVAQLRGLPTHELDTVERVSHRIVILHRGHVVADDSIVKLRSMMELPSLEAIFSQLAVDQDPQAIAHQITDLIRA